ncbi:hypothetical protein K6W76_33930, partial [Burkholderia anthina]|uniref:hypothetical protein n=1 Tax=Burkholderia anthina TaxID=179879 RepID=UPI001C968558
RRPGSTAEPGVTQQNCRAVKRIHVICESGLNPVDGYFNGLLRNLSKSPKLAYVVFEGGTNYTKYRKNMDPPVFRPAAQSGKHLEDVRAYPKQQLYRSGRFYETISPVESPTPGMRSYQLSRGQMVKVLGWGEGTIDKEYPLATGTSRPGQVCITDGMAVCMAVVVGGIANGSGKAKLKVFHIQPDINSKGVDAVRRYVDRLDQLGYTELKVAMHGGNVYPRHESEKIKREKSIVGKLRSIFDRPNITVELDEAGERRGTRNSALGGVIEAYTTSNRQTRYRIRIINELVLPPA